MMLVAVPHVSALHRGRLLACRHSLYALANGLAYVSCVVRMRVVLSHHKIRWQSTYFRIVIEYGGVSFWDRRGGLGGGGYENPITCKLSCSTL